MRSCSPSIRVARRAPVSSLALRRASVAGILLLAAGAAQAVPYCEITFLDVDPEPISRVWFAGVDNLGNLDTPAHLEDFLHLSMPVTTGSTQPIVLEAVASSESLGNDVSVFVDWNQDGDFDDAGETYVIGNIRGSTGLDGKRLYGNISVPADALVGNTRMRVVSNMGLSPSACTTGNLTRGQAHDYKLEVTDVPPVGFSELEVLGPVHESEQLHLSFAELLDKSDADAQASAAVVGFRVQDLVDGTLSIGGAPFAPSSNDLIDAGHAVVWTPPEGVHGRDELAFTLTALDAMGDESSPPVPAWVKVTSFAFPLPYCSPQYTLNTHPITRVKFGAIDNRSDESIFTPSHENFVDVQTSLTRGSAYPIAIEGNTDGWTTDAISLFIDWNQDNDFDDDEERHEIGLLVNSTGVDGQQVTGTITVPSWATPGVTRMRVSKHNTNYGAACGRNTFGQAEDYSLLIEGGEGFSRMDVLGPALEGETLSLSLATLLDKSNAQALSARPITGFRVKAVLTGSLSIGGQLYNALSNNLIDTGHSAQWTPREGSRGDAVHALMLVAVDDNGDESWPAVRVAVKVTTLLGDGDGSAEEPWTISSLSGLMALQDYRYDHFVLSTDLDLGGDAPDGPFWNGGAGWAPLDDFSGTLDGDGHVIRGLYINRPSGNDVGLFSRLTLATIKNLTLEEVDVVGKDYVGGLVGESDFGSTIIDTRVSGSVAGHDFVGGLAGGNSNGSVVRGSRADVDVLGNEMVGGLIGADLLGTVRASLALGSVRGDGYVGGLVGYIAESTLEENEARGVVSATSYNVGGLVGFNDDSSIHRSVASGDVSGHGSVGGLIGYHTHYIGNAHIVDSYARGAVSASAGSAGGLAGESYYDVGAGGELSIRRSYASGSVSGGASQGGLVGLDSDTEILDSFWDSDSSGHTGTSGGGTGLGSAQMKEQGSFTNWDFASVWAIDAAINDGYPFLRWQQLRNTAPAVLASIADHSGRPGDAFALDLSTHFSDADGDALQFSVSGLPASLTLDAGLMSGTLTLGNSTVTATATDVWGASTSLTFRLRVSSPSRPGGSNIVDTGNGGGQLSGNITITPRGVFNGGSLSGQVSNAGLITGEVDLGANTRIDGGSIAGSLRGNANAPALIVGADVAAGSYLENVVIGAGTVLDPQVRLGPNVRFESAADIPPGIDLSNILRGIPWASRPDRVVGLDLDGSPVSGGLDPMTLLRSMQLLQDFEPSGLDLDQDRDSGELWVDFASFAARVIPVAVTQAEPGASQGVFYTDDGDLVFVTTSGQRVTAYPVLNDEAAFAAGLAGLELLLGFDERANLRVDALEDRDRSPDVSYIGRPLVTAVPAHRGSVPGLHFYRTAEPAGVDSVSLIYEDENGRLMEQDIAPLPADWSALKATLSAFPAAEDVRIDAQGFISLTFDGVLIRGRTDYAVFRSGTAGGEGVALADAGDRNGDGVHDLLLTFPNGEQQILYLLPL